MPKPFSRIGMAIGEPIEVVDTQEYVVEVKRAQLEGALRALEGVAQALATGAA